MRQARYDYPMLRDLHAGDFNENGQGVMMSGRTFDRDVVVIVYRDAIGASFPKIASAAQCVSFVERNLDPFRGLVNRKLSDGKPAPSRPSRGRAGAGLFVEVDAFDVARAKRWLTP
jgi:hypothetical protein